ncbi:MAG TPA: hypothetical protein PK357_03065 [Candidatus Pacearchaeota archaeon]|nr:hypothetical protein [Candidatus Pacearchaeota archaeon]
MLKLELKVNHLEKSKFKEISKYLNSAEFQKDFPHGHWEKGKGYSGKILTITGEPIVKTTTYINVTIKLAEEVREDEGLDYSIIRKNIKKLGKHYKTITGILFSGPADNLRFQ